MMIASRNEEQDFEEIIDDSELGSLGIGYKRKESIINPKRRGAPSALGAEIDLGCAYSCPNMLKGNLRKPPRSEPIVTRGV